MTAYLYPGLLLRVVPMISNSFKFGSSNNLSKSTMSLNLLELANKCYSLTSFCILMKFLNELSSIFKHLIGRLLAKEFLRAKVHKIMPKWVFSYTSNYLILLWFRSSSLNCLIFSRQSTFTISLWSDFKILSSFKLQNYSPLKSFSWLLLTSKISKFLIVSNIRNCAI